MRSVSCWHEHRTTYTMQWNRLIRSMNVWAHLTSQLNFLSLLAYDFRMFVIVEGYQNKWYVISLCVHMNGDNLHLASVLGCFAMDLRCSVNVQMRGCSLSSDLMLTFSLAMRACFCSFVIACIFGTAVFLVFSLWAPLCRPPDFTGSTMTPSSFSRSMRPGWALWLLWHVCIHLGSLFVCEALPLLAGEAAKNDIGKERGVQESVTEGVLKFGSQVQLFIQSFMLSGGLSPLSQLTSGIRPGAHLKVHLPRFSL